MFKRVKVTFISFITERIFKSNKKSFSNTASRIAIVSICVGVLISQLSFGILLGFRESIKNKLFSFTGHIMVSRFDSDRSFEKKPIDINYKFIEKCENNSDIKIFQKITTKPGLLKSESMVQGVVLKGVYKDYHLDLFKNNIIEGRFLDYQSDSVSKEIIISKKISEMLQLKIGESLQLCFVQKPPRIRKVTICGIYETGMEEFDLNYCMVDGRILNKVSNWTDNQVGGYEIYAKDFEKLDLLSSWVYEQMDFDLAIEKVSDQFIQLFDWLQLLDKNVYIIIVLVLVIAIFNVLATFFIIIIERIHMIGTLRSLGASQNQVLEIIEKQIFKLCFKGILIGNIIFIAIYWIQKQTHILPLDAENYYISYVPINFDLMFFGLVNIFIIIVIFLVIYLLKKLVKINLIDAIKFD